MPDALSRWIGAQGHLRQVRSYGSEKLNSLAEEIAKRSDMGRIRRLWADMQGVYKNDKTSAAKYADFDSWIWFNVERAAKLKLHESKPLRMLDIGCGPSYFLAAARALGHECYGVDLPESYFTPTEKRVYGELLPALGVKQYVSPLLVERYQPLAIEHRDLDLITAYWICFNRHRQPDEWGRKEWEYFIANAKEHLRAGGVLHLELNAHPEKYGALTFYDEDTLAFFRSAGRVERNRVRITKS
jgi:SAM-dependent methyltransferase